MALRVAPGGAFVDAYWMADTYESEAPASVYRGYLESGQLGFQSCGDCGAAIFYPRVICPYCGGADLRWQTSAGFGMVYATTAVYHRDREPHNVALIDLDEGFRMMARVEGIPAERVEIGARMVFEVRREDSGPVAVFVPEGS